MDRLALCFHFLLLNSHIPECLTHTEPRNQLTKSILGLIDLKPNTCLSFIYSTDPSIDSSSQHDNDMMARTLFSRHQLYTLTPLESHRPEDFVIGPSKPYPCVYVIHLVKGSSTVLRFFMNGTYQTSWHSSKESTYIVYSRTRHEIREIKSVFKTLYEFGIINVLFVNTSPVEVFTVFPFGHHQDACPESLGVPERIGNFTDGKLRLDRNPTPFQIPRAFNACELRISTLNYPPFILVDWEGPRDSVKIDGNRVGGFDAVAMKFLASHLNLNIAWRVFERAGWKTLVKNTTWLGSVPLLAEGKVDICCGGLRSEYFIKSADNLAYVNVKIIIYAPVPDLKAKWKMVYCGFSSEIWCTFIFTIVIFPVAFWLVGRRLDKTLTLSKTVFLVVGIVFSNSPGSLNSSSIVVCTMEFVWKMFAQHISMAYSAYLAGFVTYRKYEAPIRTVDQLLDSQLPAAALIHTAGSFLAHDSKLTRYLKSNYFVIETDAFPSSLMMAGRYRNFTIVDIDKFIDYTLKNEAPSAQVYDTGISLGRLTVGSVMYRHNYLMPQVKAAMTRMIETGIKNKILSDLVSHTDWLSESSHVQELKNLNLIDLSGPFYILTIGYCLSLTAFICEVLYKRYKRQKRGHRKCNEIQVVPRLKVINAIK